MQTWEIGFEDDHTERVDAGSGTGAMFKAEKQYQAWVESLGMRYGYPAVASCREVCIELRS